MGRLRFKVLVPLGSFPLILRRLQALLKGKKMNCVQESYIQFTKNTLKAFPTPVPPKKLLLKAGFHMIADRRSQIAIRSAIVCDHIGNYFCDRLRSCETIAEDRTMFYLKAGFHMIADERRPYCDLRSAIIWKPALKGNS